MFWKNRIPNGATGHDNINDWTAEALQEDIRKLPIPKLEDPDSIMNQGANTKTKSSCTIAGAYLQICQIFGKQANNKELLEVVEWCHDNLGYDYTGQLSSTGANMAIKWWNAHNEDKLLYIKMEYDNPDLHYLMFDKNFLVGATYKGNRAYGRDYRPDGILNKTSFKPSTYGHRTNLFGLGVFDSYVGGTRNEYRLGEDFWTLGELVKNGVFYPTFYLILKESWISGNIEKIKEKEKEKRIAEIFVNALSLFWQYSTSTEKTQISKLAKKYRKEYNIENLPSGKGKTMAIVVAVMKEFFTYVEDDKRKDIINAILSL